MIASLVRASCVLLAGCQAAGGPALRPVADDDRPDVWSNVGHAYTASRDVLPAALDHSLVWLDDPASVACFPAGPITHARTRASVRVFRDLLEHAADAQAFRHALVGRFDVYEAAGGDGDGRMLFTGYFAPEYAAARQATARFRYPLYGPPSDFDRSRVGPTRAAIESGELLAGREIAWLDDAMHVYLIHVNGSARLRLPDGDVMHVDHVGTNGRPYTSLGRLLIDERVVPEPAMSMQAIVTAHRQDPTRIETLMRRNDRYVYFREVPGDAWPVSGIGVRLTPEASVATDKSLFPAGAVVLVVTEVPTADGSRPFVRFMLDQDRGGAITGPGRADLYMGVGAEAGRVAGRLKASGRMYYLLLRD